MKPFFTLLILFFTNFVYAQTKYQKDFLEFWNDINQNYAYLEQQNIDWQKVKEIYKPESAKISDDKQFISFLENVLNELYNGHSSLNVNLNSSNRIIPSGQDIFVKKINEKYLIYDLRKGFGAELSGLKTGMELAKFNGKNIDEQLLKFLPKSVKNPTPKMIEFALNMLFAGTHDKKREITAIENGTTKIFFPENPEKFENAKPMISSEILNEKTAIIKINNSLGNNNSISEFDEILDNLMNFKNIIIDLTETPSGGNSTVARAIMGRFTEKILPYQIHEFDEKEFETKRHWEECVTPRKKIYKGKVYVLVGYFTGSMGEGIAIGFSGMKRAKIIGTKMAGLLGAISGFQLQETKIGYQFPTERLYHINGIPRENFVPEILTKNNEETFAKAKAIK